MDKDIKIAKMNVAANVVLSLVGSETADDDWTKDLYKQACDYLTDIFKEEEKE